MVNNASSFCFFSAIFLKHIYVCSSLVNGKYLVKTKHVETVSKRYKSIVLTKNCSFWLCSKCIHKDEFKKLQNLYHMLISLHNMYNRITTSAKSNIYRILT